VKLTFEGTYFNDILNQIAELLEAQRARPVDEPPKPQGPGPETSVSPTEPFAGPVDNPVQDPVEKPKVKPGKVRSAKQLENDERLRKLAVEKAAAKKAPVADEPEPAPKASAPIDPADLIKLRTKTIAELQEAYANGQQKEVFELLSKYGKGAKSFRELPAEAFGPIREAIDAGALA
jgi:hypothetical protein